MKTFYAILLTGLLTSLNASANELDQERQKRIERRFGKLVQVEESTAAGVPELPPEPTAEEENTWWDRFGGEDDTLSRNTVAPQMQPRYVRRAPKAEKEGNGWGWLHAEVVAEQEKKAAELSAVEEASRQSAEEAWRSSAMSEDEIQREVARRLQQQSGLQAAQTEDDKLNPLRQLQEYKAMGQDYLTPAQRMLSPEYTRERLARGRATQQSGLTELQPYSPATYNQPQSSGISTPYGTGSTMGTLRQSSALPRASTLSPQQGQARPGATTDTYGTQPRSTIHDLRKLPSLDEQDPFTEQFPKARRSIWDE